MQVELGLDTFGDTTLGPDGRLKPHEQVLREVVEQGVLADELGIHFLGIGEHHRADFSVSAPEVVLSAIAARTSRIRLGSAVTVLSSDDPVRVFQRFSTLNAISNGRAEVILGRGSFTESFPLFGYALDDYELLFEEKLDLFTHLIRDRSVPPAPVDGRASSGPAGPSAHRVRAMKALLVAMASDRVPPDVRVDELNQPVQLWAEARFALMRRYEGRGLSGEKYLLQNISAAVMVLAEQEFDRPDSKAGGQVLGVAVEHHQLRPGESTSVYVIRRGGER